MRGVHGACTRTVRKGSAQKRPAHCACMYISWSMDREIYISGSTDPHSPVRVGLLAQETSECTLLPERSKSEAASPCRPSSLRGTVFRAFWSTKSSHSLASEPSASCFLSLHW